MSQASIEITEPTQVSLTQVEEPALTSVLEILVPGPPGPAGPQGPAGSVGGVDSVNGATGVVVLDAADVGAAPAGHTHLLADVTDLALPSQAEAEAGVATSGRIWSAERVKQAILALTPPPPPDAVDSVNGQTGAVVLDAADVDAVPTSRTVAGKPLSADVTLAKADVGLGNVDNTSDAAKPVSTAQQAALDGKSNVGHTHIAAQVSGLATVATSGDAGDLTGTLPTAVLPPLAVNETFTVASQAAMLALTAQRGDMAVRTDNGLTYVLSADAPDVLANWKEVMAAGQVQSVNGQTGVVSLGAGDVGAVPTSRTVNGQPLSANVSLAAADVGAVPTTRTVAGKALSADVTLAASDVGAVPTSRTVAGKALSADVTLVKGDVGLGNVDNTSDANKPISTATQTALDGKSNVGHTHAFKNLSETLTAISEVVGAWTVTDDGTSSASWPNRLTVNYDPLAGETVATFFLNEYGEARCVPAKTTTTGLRAFAKQFSTSTAHSTSVPIVELMDDRDNRNSKWAVYSDGRVVQSGGITASGDISAPNVQNKVVTVPTGTTGFASQPDGTLWVEYTP